MESWLHITDFVVYLISQVRVLPLFPPDFLLLLLISSLEVSQLGAMAIFSKTIKTPSNPILEDKESRNIHVEDVDSLKVTDEKAQGDYSGATAKIDPAEIKLVRKLDFRIMPILWAMYFLNYVTILPTCAYCKLIN